MNNKINGKNKSNGGNKGKKSFYFLGIMILIYIILFIINGERLSNSLLYVWGITKEILPILVLVYAFMLIFMFIDENKLKSSIEKAPRLLKYILMSLLGTISHGPIYAWYPFLKELNKKNISLGGIGTFLYARGIKLTLLPMLITYFDFKFVLILTVVTLFFSIVEGFLLDSV